MPIEAREDGHRRRTSKTQMFVSHTHALKTTKPIMEYYKVDVSNPSPTFKSMSNISWSPCDGIWDLSHTSVSYIPLSFASWDIITSVWDKSPYPVAGCWISYNV